MGDTNGRPVKTFKKFQSRWRNLTKTGGGGNKLTQVQRETAIKLKLVIRADKLFCKTILPVVVYSCFFSVFYRAVLCICSTSHGLVSVHLSVTSRSSTKTAKRRITQTTSHDSPGTLVFRCQRSLRNSTRITPCGGTKYRWGGS